MPTKDIIFRFIFSEAANSDIRTFNVKQLIEVDGHVAEIDIYRFHHLVTGHKTGETTFHRKNLSTLIFEVAGQVEWSSALKATVHFGIEEVPITDLRKAKKTNSKSRRFKAGGSEYKWKIAENETDLFCVDSRGKTVTTWAHEEGLLRVVPRVESILDRLVVTCVLNLWFRQIGRW